MDDVWLGDLARVCFIHLHQRLPEFLDVASKQLNTPKPKENVSVANNACWAIGELAIKVRQEISPIAMTVISSLVPILQHAEGLNKSLSENSSITLGRLAWVCPELVSLHTEHFMQSWCIALSMIRDDIEKEDAFRGLCAMEIRSEELRNEIFQVLLGPSYLIEKDRTILNRSQIPDAQQLSMGTVHVLFGAPSEGKTIKISSIEVS